MSRKPITAMALVLMAAAFAFHGARVRAGEYDRPFVTPGRAVVDATTRAYFTFDTAVDGKYPDEKDKNAFGEVRGKVIPTPGLFGQAVRSVGDGCVAVTAQSLKSLRQPEVEFYVRRGNPFSETTLLELADGKGGFVWQLTLLGTEKGARLQWVLNHDNQATTTVRSCRGLDTPDRWYRVLLKHVAQGCYVYLDGYLVGEDPTRRRLPPASGPLLVRTPAGGAIDELALSERGIAPIHPHIENRIIAPANLDFEARAEGWVGVHDACRIDGEVKHGGQYSLRIETDDAYTREYLSPIFSVEPGATYRVTFWAKVDTFEAGYASVSVWFRWYFAPEETCSFGGDLVAYCLHDQPPRTFGWRKFSAEIPVWHDKSFFQKIRWARIQVKNHHSHVRAWVDDITVEKLGGKDKDVGHDQ